MTAASRLRQRRQPLSNAKTSQLGVYAVVNGAGDGLSFQSANSFSLADTPTNAGEGIFGAGSTAATTNFTSTAPTTGNNSNAQAAITAINSAIQALGLVQGSVGAGENKLQYAIGLAQSQISNFSAAESQIRDANIASDAANLTKSQGFSSDRDCSHGPGQFGASIGPQTTARLILN